MAMTPIRASDAARERLGVTGAMAAAFVGGATMPPFDGASADASGCPAPPAACYAAVPAHGACARRPVAAVAGR